MILPVSEIEKSLRTIGKSAEEFDAWMRDLRVGDGAQGGLLPMWCYERLMQEWCRLERKRWKLEATFPAGGVVRLTRSA